jgi:hypothetical protein
MRKVGDEAVVHGLRGRSNRKIDEKTKQQTIEILKRDVYRGFRPTLASEYLAKRATWSGTDGQGQQGWVSR